MTFIHYGRGCESFMAMQRRRSGPSTDSQCRTHAGVLVGSGIGGIRGIEEQTAITLHEGGPRKVSPFYIPSTIINMISGQLSHHQRLQRP